MPRIGKEDEVVDYLNEYEEDFLPKQILESKDQEKEGDGDNVSPDEVLEKVLEEAHADEKLSADAKEEVERWQSPRVYLVF